MTAPAEVGRSALAAALGVPVWQLVRARERGEIAEPDRATMGGHARWSIAAAKKILRQYGKPIPKAWES